MNTSKNLHPQHAAWAKLNPPREGYTCGPHAETFGGGCFNCGWKGTVGGTFDEPAVNLTLAEAKRRATR